MAKPKSRKTYIEELTKRVEERIGKPCENFLMPQLTAAASMMRMIDRIDYEMDKQDLVISTEGSTGQPKTMANPLIAEYQRCQRILNAQLTSLGLTYDSTPKKITDSTKDSDVNKQDEIDKMYNDF